MISACAIAYPKRSARSHELDPRLDPAVIYLIELGLSGRVPWGLLTPAVRSWIYHPPLLRTPPIGVIRENLNLHDRDLAVVPLAEDWAV